MQALAGVNPQKPEDRDKAEVAAAFFELFPQFQLFKDPKVADRLSRLLAQSDELTQASDHVWDGLTRRTLDRITEAIADELGVDASEIDDQTKREQASLFFQMGQADPDTFRKRYEREDPKLVTEYMERLRSRYFEPARRKAASSFMRGQPRVPNSGPSRPVVSVPPNIDYGDRDAVENAAVQYMKDRGHLQGSSEA